MDFNEIYKKLYEHESKIDEDSDLSIETAVHNDIVKKNKIDSMKRQDREQSRFDLLKKKNRDSKQKKRQQNIRKAISALSA